MWMIVAGCALILAQANAVRAQDRQAAKPNIIFILSDDQGYNDIGYHGSPIMTPHLDRLAAEGVHLTQYYAYSTCSPTRVALLTGRNPARYNVVSPLGATTEVRPRDMHLPNALRDLGYTTHISGKWHIGEIPEHRPLRNGFDTSYGYLRGQIDPYTHRYKYGNHVTWHRNDEFIDEDGHVTRLITDEAIRVIRERAESDKPFFLYVAHHAPHFPLNEPPQYIEPYKEIFDDIWRRHYAASLTHMDEQIGRIIDALEQTGQRENTVVIFASDNGGQREWAAPPGQYNGRYAPHLTLGDNTPFRGWKGGLHEGSIRVPALVNWPGVVPAGQVISEPTHTLDWAVTLIRLAGGEVDSAWDLHGLDMWPAIQGQRSTLSQGSPARLFWRQGRWTAYREGDWKLLQQPNGGLSLFNLADDPQEQNDRAADEPEVFERLKRGMEAQRPLGG